MCICISALKSDGNCEINTMIWNKHEIRPYLREVAQKFRYLYQSDSGSVDVGALSCNSCVKSFRSGEF
jgi:hypothetical protein